MSKGCYNIFVIARSLTNTKGFPIYPTPYPVIPISISSRVGVCLDTIPRNDSFSLQTTIYLRIPTYTASHLLPEMTWAAVVGISHRPGHTHLRLLWNQHIPIPRVTSGG
ncbi:hypothetical protein M378DRAFT_157923 [Amanita muscaria Koide BX008]|uniref:Uncharacterized protein n=1 Tax=Amanita muscaria (strain Koide BX008) TaxID=946122 RepID=A0A0C2TNL7_AMAMK|nr:hypothetical protein M378DRAFT_157923 [Amanita muscaria Koide BX008]